SGGVMRPSVRSTIGAAALAILLSVETLVAQQQPAGIPALSPPQLHAIADLTAAISPLVDAAISARAELVAASFALPRRDDALGAAELTLAEARADRIAALQSSDAALSPYQIAALVVLGGTLRTTGLAFTEPDPPDVTDHAGYVPLFDGVSLNGWDGNSKFW